MSIMNRGTMSVQEESFLSKLDRVADGLKAPHDTGEYKAAIHELKRRALSSSTSTVVCLIVIALLALFVIDAPVPKHRLQVDIAPRDVFEMPDNPPPDDLPTELDHTMDQLPTMQLSDLDVPGVAPSPQPAAAQALKTSPRMPVLIAAGGMPGRIGSIVGPPTGIARYRNAWRERRPAGRGETAVLKALRWLKDNQKSDGSWEGPGAAMTGLALLCYMAHGETTASREFGPTVEKAVRYLVDNQQSDGRWPARLCGGHYVYGHAMATYGLAEAYGMTKIFMLRDPVARAARVIVDGQQAGGAWDYDYSKGARSDLSVSAWQVQALKAAKLAHIGIDGLDDALEMSVEGIRSFAARPEGTLSYNAGRGAGSLTLTGAGALCFQFLHKQNDRSAVAAMKAIEAAPCDWNAGEKHNNTYAWYYMTQAKFHRGGRTWDAWNDRMLPMLVKNQHSDGHWRHGKTHHSSDVYDTCLCCLSLEVYYRYLPTFIEVSPRPPRSGAHEQRDIEISII